MLDINDFTFCIMFDFNFYETKNDKIVPKVNKGLMWLYMY